MKLLVAFLALAQCASETSWAISTWWEKANAVYDWATNNPDQFNALIASGDDSHFLPLWGFCGGID